MGPHPIASLAEWAAPESRTHSRWLRQQLRGGGLWNHFDRRLMRLPASFFLILISLVNGAAQVASTGPEAFYEGQTVTAVDLIANPHRDVEPLRTAVSQKVGQPYSQAAVQASISALQRAGGFEKVTVNVIPDIAGLRLNFILEPAYYLGIIDFQRLAKLFSYTRLLQVANLQTQDPYDQARIPVAEAALSQFLQQNGYFQAQVHSEATNRRRKPVSERYFYCSDRQTSPHWECGSEWPGRCGANLVAAQNAIAASPV